MGPRIIVTWALPVDTVTLGGRLEAYVESKASLHTFKLCIQHSQADRALGKLPAEMIENIASIFQQAQFEDRIEEWIEARECEDGDLDEREDVSDRIYTSFDKCQKIFADDFGLEIYFDTFTDWNEDSWEDHEKSMFAYIILPATVAEMTTSSLVLATHTLFIIFDPSILHGLTTQQKAQFEVALSMLHLVPTVHKLQLHYPQPTSNLFLAPDKVRRAKWSRYGPDHEKKAKEAADGKSIDG